jgi:hypothetical protein
MFPILDKYVLSQTTNSLSLIFSKQVEAYSKKSETIEEKTKD